MPHMDMSMEEGAFDGSDYSDFRYQFARAENSITSIGSDTNVGQSTLNTFEPLESSGGLDNNEVAELVAYELLATTEFEDEENDQNTASTVAMRGTLGSNLPASAQAGIHPPAGQQTQGEIFDVTGDVLDETSQVNEKVENRIFQMFSASQGVPFDSQNSGAGGNATASVYQAKRNYRDLTGRGPVLDATDDISIFIDINAGDVIAPLRGEVYVHLIWDVAEVSDAGRAFSVPSDD